MNFGMLLIWILCAVYFRWSVFQEEVVSVDFITKKERRDNIYITLFFDNIFGYFVQLLLAPIMFLMVFLGGDLWMFIDMFRNNKKPKNN